MPEETREAVSHPVLARPDTGQARQAADPPTRTQAKQDINVRKALAGIGLLQGKRKMRALIDAGYSPATARSAHPGLRADACIQEARKLDPSISPASLLAEARRVMMRRLETLDPETTPLQHVARAVEVAEKWYGGADPDRPDREARSFLDRLAMLRATMREAERRGLVGHENDDSRPPTGGIEGAVEPT